MALNWKIVTAYCSAMIIGGIIVWIIIPKNGGNLSELKKSDKVLETNIKNIERLLDQATDRGNFWEGRFNFQAKAYRDSLQTSRKANRAYRDLVARSARLFTKEQIDSATKAIVAHYEKSHEVMDDSFDNSIVIKTANDGIECDSLNAKLTARTDQAEAALVTADSTLKAKDEIDSLHKQKDLKQDSLLGNSRKETKAVKKQRNKWIGIGIVATVVAIAEFVKSFAD